MFNCNRLALARKRRQLTKKELSQLSGISAVTLTRIEVGETAEPALETIEALAKALEYPLDFFFGDDCEVLKTEEVSFRSLSSLTARQRDAALAAGPIAFIFEKWVTERFNLPNAELLDLRDEDPVSAAISIREHWGIGTKPIPAIIKLLEAKGVRVFSLAEKNKNVDAYSCWRDETPYIFLNTFKSAERSRFDAAHELGHLVLHRHGVSGARDIEREADLFASALLIHRGDLISHLPRAQSLAQLIKAKERWGVSVAALARTAFNTGLLSDWSYRELCKQMSILGYRTKEPNGRPRERSILWQKVLEELWKDGITREKISTYTNIPEDELRSLVDPLVSEQTPIPSPTEKRPILRVV